MRAIKGREAKMRLVLTLNSFSLAVRLRGKIVAQRHVRAVV